MARTHPGPDGSPHYPGSHVVPALQPGGGGRHAEEKDTWRYKPVCDCAEVGATDPEYKEDQGLAQQKWLQNNPGYWKGYRKGNPGKVQRNLSFQEIRNLKSEDDYIAIVFLTRILIFFCAYDLCFCVLFR